MARYVAYVETKLAEGVTVNTPLVVDLKTAKALAQLDVDNDRTRNRHLRQEPLSWYRTHSDRVVRWFGFIDNEVEIIFESLVA